MMGVAGAGIAAAVLLRRALKRDDPCAVPELKFKSFLDWLFPIKAVFRLGKDHFLYGMGRLVLEGVDPSLGIGRIRIMGQTYYFVRDPELVDEVVKKNYQAGGGFGKSFKGDVLEKMIEMVFGRGLIFSEDGDPNWALAHKILTRPFSHRGVMEMVPIMLEQADKLVAALKHEATLGNAVYVYDYMVKMALETIAVCSMGTRFNAFDAQEEHPFPTAFNGVMESLFDLIDLPVELWSLCRWTMAKIRKAVGVMDEVFDDIIQKRLRKETSSLGKFPDLLELMLNPGSGSKRFSDELIRAHMLAFLFAGHDSTAAAMSSLITLTVANPRVEERLVKEIQEVVGNDELQAHHLPQLTYLDWCIKETLRLFPPAANFQRMAFEDGLLLGGRWRIPKMGPVVVDVFALHHDEDTWGSDADCFVPERWESEPTHSASYMPFAAGPRGCIGKEFTLVEQKIVAVKFFQNFSMQGVPDFEPRKGSVLVKASEKLAHTRVGIDVEYSPRQFFVGASIPVKLRERAAAREQRPA